MRILAAVSGGVDSALCARLLLEQGHELVLGHLVMHPGSQEALEDAERVAASLGLPLEVRHLEEEFRRAVVEPFVAEYLRARTPSPCVLCNPRFKIRQLLLLAEETGCQLAATGHYARISRDRAGAHLLQGLSGQKDQSYFLSRLSQDQLQRLVFPLGEMTKEEVRRRAGEYGLPVAGKKDSQEICFIPDDDYPAFLAAGRPEAFQPGPILDLEGRQLGTHPGLPHYTIGQRKKIGAHCVRKYVVRLDRERNAVVIGDDGDLAASGARLEDMTWLQPPSQGEFQAAVKIRSTSPPRPCTVTLLPGGAAQVAFARPERAVTPGQAGVIYRDGEVLGAGLIAG